MSFKNREIQPYTFEPANKSIITGSQTHNTFICTFLLTILMCCVHSENLNPKKVKLPSNDVVESVVFFFSVIMASSRILFAVS